MLEIKIIDAAGPELDVVRKLFGEYIAELGENLVFQQFDAEQENPLKKYGRPKGVLLLANWNGVPAGCVAFAPMANGGVCEMKRLYVRPVYRAYGIGRRLVDAVLAAAVESGYLLMRLDTLARLEAAIRLYKAYDFGVIPAYYDNPLPGVVYMEKQLQA